MKMTFVVLALGTAVTIGCFNYVEQTKISATMTVQAPSLACDREASDLWLEDYFTWHDGYEPVDLEERRAAHEERCADVPPLTGYAYGDVTLEFCAEEESTLRLEWIQRNHFGMLAPDKFVKVRWEALGRACSKYPDWTSSWKPN